MVVDATLSLCPQRHLITNSHVVCITGCYSRVLKQYDTILCSICLFLSRTFASQAVFCSFEASSANSAISSGTISFPRSALYKPFVCKYAVSSYSMGELRTPCRIILSFAVKNQPFYCLAIHCYDPGPINCYIMQLIIYKRNFERFKNSFSA